MHANNPYMLLATNGPYVPYFYQAGLYLRYNMPTARAPGQYRAAASSYDFSSVRPLWHDRNSIQTVEDVIARGYFAVPRSDPIAAIITDKQHTSRLGLDDVIHQAQGRLALYQANMQELEESICEANNAVHRQVADQGRPADNRQQYSTNKQVQKLYEQKRMERVNLWRDVSRLRLVLPEQAQNYLAAYRKAIALRSYGGGVL
ncbi:MAG: hypothetical protein JXA69_08295 [Phycisphaerae bacterium]|nr:hypothetical protein [Phycisphaerae bacterium]